MKITLAIIPHITPAMIGTSGEDLDVKITTVVALEEAADVVPAFCGRRSCRGGYDG